MSVRVNPKITEWLLKQPWRSKFIDNLIVEEHSPKNILQILLGNLGRNTISSPFTWIYTPEGYDFWDKIYNEFVMIREKENWGDFDIYISL